MSYSLNGNLSLKAYNDLHDTDVETTFTVAVYETIKDVLTAGALLVRSVTDRKLIPVDQRSKGVGTAKEYLKGTIFLKREAQGDAAVKCLIPKDDTLRTTLKTDLMSLTIGGEKPTDISFKLDSI